MLTTVHPKLPMRNKSVTHDFYTRLLGFTDIGTTNYPHYLLLKRDDAELHFFHHSELNPAENYGQVYFRTTNIELLYNNWLKNGVAIHPNGELQLKPWGQKEFAVLDPDHNLLTFGEASTL